MWRMEKEMMTEDEIIEVTTAYKNGEQIQFYDSITGEWENIYKPLWNFGTYKYRIKPKPTKLKYTEEDMRLIVNNHIKECIYRLETYENNHRNFASIDEVIAILISAQLEE
jgi:hypothetical protein